VSFSQQVSETSLNTLRDLGSDAVTRKEHITIRNYVLLYKKNYNVFLMIYELQNRFPALLNGVVKKKS
jgi:hypothetical protein